MAWDGMGAFVRALDERGELVRIRRRVDVHLDIAAIADRVMKAGGPALLFEDPSGSAFPVNACPSAQAQYRLRSAWTTSKSTHAPSSRSCIPAPPPPAPVQSWPSSPFAA